MLDGSLQVLRDVAMAVNFGTQFAITGFVGYNLFHQNEYTSGSNKDFHFQNMIVCMLRLSA